MGMKIWNAHFISLKGKTWYIFYISEPERNHIQYVATAFKERATWNIKEYHCDVEPLQLNILLHECQEFIHNAFFLAVRQWCPAACSPTSPVTQILCYSSDLFNDSQKEAYTVCVQLIIFATFAGCVYLPTLTQAATCFFCCVCGESVPGSAFW